MFPSQWSDGDSDVQHFYEHLEDSHVVRINPLILFLLLLLYSAIGGVIFSTKCVTKAIKCETEFYFQRFCLHISCQSNSEKWPFYNSIYFAFITCMKIGFGDFVPGDILSIYCSIIYALRLFLTSIY